MDNKSTTTVGISSRLLETRKQTEELKTQLQNLIDSGINSSFEYNKAESHFDKENQIESQNKVQIIKSFDAKYSNHVGKSPQPKAVRNVKQNDKKVKQVTPKESPKKERDYDVKDYMKKQRVQRAQLLKAQSKDTTKLDQKKKLQELHKKSLELVARNLEAKKQRSKSHEGRDFVRPDQDSRTRARSYSRDRRCLGGNNEHKCDTNRSRSVDHHRYPEPAREKRNPNLLYPPTPDYITRNRSRNKQNKSEEHANELCKKCDGQMNMTNMSTMVLDKTITNFETVPKSNLNGDSSKTMEPINLCNKMSKSKPVDLKAPESENLRSVTNILEYSSTKSSLKSQKPRNVLHPGVALDTLVLQSQQNEKPVPKPKLSEVAIGTDNLEKDTKETQTGNEQKIEFPIWLQEKPVAYPFNFISSVKRKLQDAVKFSKHSVDVGIQSSLMDEKQKTPENLKTKEAIMEMLQNSTKSSKKSDLKSFISHKCLNLDPQTIDHLELIPKNSALRDVTLTQASVAESESDTSKNIPEISSESESKPKESGSGLDVERLNKLKLRPHDVKTKTVNAGSKPLFPLADIDDTNILTTNEEYTSEFTSESDLSKRRDSIIAYNSPSYHKQIIYDRSPEYDKAHSRHNGSAKVSVEFPQTVSTESDGFEKVSTTISENRSRSKSPNGIVLNTEKLSKLKLKAPDVKSDFVKSVDQVDATAHALRRQKLKISDTQLEKEKSKFLTVNNGHRLDFQSSSDFSKSQEMPSNKQNVLYKNRNFDKPHVKSSNSEVHSNNIPEIMLSTHSRDIPGSISKRSNTERTQKNVSETYSIKTDNIEMPSASIKLISTISGAPRSKESKSSKSSKTAASIRNKEKSDIKLKRKDKENKSTSSIVTETESRGSSKGTLDSQERSSQSSKKSEKYTSLCTDLHSSPTSDALSKSESNLTNINTRRGCSSFSRSDKLTEIIPLKEPTISLVVANEKTKGKYDEKQDRSKLMKNISLRSEKSIAPNDQNNTNEIHLKFEAEIHLLNDFNESLRQFSAVEKAFESLKSKNDSITTINKILQNRDTQTSIVTKSSTGSKSTEHVNTANRSRSDISTINYSRGSFINDDSGSINLEDTIISKLDDSLSKLDDKSVVSTGVEISNLNKSSSMMKSTPDLSNFENLHSSSYAHMTLKMFEQLIKDEDVRLENLKTILKIREQALLDRTKGELVWLEIQRKHLRETGKLQEASFIKKKQRGILVNHQKEKHEMQRLRQMQKAASIERKTILKEQRNLIKHQLSTDTMLSKMKVSTPRERRLSGPLKVIQSHSESIRSETSISKRSSSEKDVYSITSHTQSIVSKVSEISVEEVISKDLTSDLEPVNQASKLTGDSGIPVSRMKKTLLMREAALQKRRKAAEELLRWHKKLLEEEKRITELESTANAIISHIPSNVPTETAVNHHKFKGKQLNQLWFKLTGCEEKKFTDDKVYPMSQISLERFCKSAREYSAKTKRLLRKVSDGEINSDQSGTRTDDSVSEHIPELNELSAKIAPKKTSSKTISTARSNDYASDFDVESIQEIVSYKDMDIVDQSLNQLIDNFSKIEADLASLGIEQSLKSSNDQEDESPRSENTGSDIEVSVIETTKTSRDEKSESGKTHSTPEKLTSHINLSIIEEINKSTRDTLNKSEEVLQKLNQSEENKTQDIGQALQTSISEDKTRSAISEIISQAISSVSSNERSEKPTQSKDITSDIPYRKESQTDETTETLNRAREILEKLSQAEDSIKTVGSKKSSLSVDDLASNKTIDNLSKTEEILERLSLTETDIKSQLSSQSKSSIIGEKHIASETADNVNKTEEILENLSLLESKISPESSNRKSSIVEHEVPIEDNLTKTEEILQRLGTENILTADDSAKKTSEDSVIEDQIAEDARSKTKSLNSNVEDIVSSDLGVTSDDEEPLLQLIQAASADLNHLSSESNAKSLSKIPSIPEDKSSADGKIEDSHQTDVKSSSSKILSIPEDKSSADSILEGTHQIDGKIIDIVTNGEVSTTSSGNSLIPSLESRNENILSQETNHISEKDITQVVYGVAQEITKSDGTEDSESLKEASVDEELSTDEQNLDGESRVEEIIEINNDEEKSINEENTASAKSGNDAIVKDYSEGKDEESISLDGISLEEKIEEPKVNKDPDNFKVDSESSSVSTQSESKSNKDMPPEVAPVVDIEVSDKHVTESLPSDGSPRSKEEINSYEEKEQDSLSSSTSSSGHSGSVAKTRSREEKSESDGSKSSVSEEKSPRNGTVDVKKRVSEIMADASQSPRGDKSPRVQDLYVTTYDLVSPATSPELGSPVEEQRIYAAKSIFGTEAEEILRKQLAIEQEIKLITEQQQKEHLPYMYVREIPNKPPPPYTPPSSLPQANVITIIPTTHEVEEITKYSAKILHKAYLSNGLDNISISDTTLGLISKDITKECYKFVFDICKEMTKEHYRQFEKEKCVSWLQMRKKPHLAEVKPLDVTGLERHLNRSLRELFGYEKPNRRENAIIKWSRKKRDHVDEILVMESQAEESQWTNYEKDELFVMNEVTNEIMNMLLKETGEVFIEILSKRT